MSLRQETIESIGWKGWHEHVYDGTVAMVWGIRPDDGCELCDLAEAWLEKEQAKTERDAVDLQQAIRERRNRFTVISGGLLLPDVRPDPVQYIDPHKPQAVSTNDAPSLEKIITKPSPAVPVRVVEQIELSAPKTVVSESTDEEPVAPPQPVAFKLTNPDQHTITRGGKRRR